MSSTRSYCVIGAGFAGLSAVRYLGKHCPDAEIVCYESQAAPGGIWTCDPTSEVGKTSPIYSELRTNFPLPIMAFAEHPPSDTLIAQGQYVGSNTVLQYLNSYVDRFKLRTHIKFHRSVVLVQANPLSNNNDLDKRWQVTTRFRDTDQIEAHDFDAVFVCSGHFSKPSLPVECLQSERKLFGGSAMHSSSFRNGRDYDGQSVLVVGAGPSGVDIACVCAKYAKKVYLCHSSSRHLNNQVFPGNVQVICVRFKAVIGQGRVLLEEYGSQEVIAGLHAILFCTGYHFAFPFLDKELAVHIHENHVQPLYKEMAHMHYPSSLFFVGLHRQVPVGRLAELQMEFAGALMKGLVPIPSLYQMLLDCEQEVTRRLGNPVNMKRRKLHKLGHLYEGGRSVFRDYVQDLHAVLRKHAVLKLEDDLVDEWVIDTLEHVCAHSVSALRH